MSPVLVKNADRMITCVNPIDDGLEIFFADGCSGVIPFSAIPEIEGPADIRQIEVPNPYVVILRNSRDETIELPWDFARHYCDDAYRRRAEAIAATGRLEIGSRIRQVREAARMTQEGLAAAAGIGRVTLVRIESGRQSPRYETLKALARALGRSTAELLTPASADALP